MFKVESSSSGATATTSNLTLNPQNNFDFELSFCDGATDDLFESFNSETQEQNVTQRNSLIQHGSKGEAGSGGNNKPEMSDGGMRIKVESSEALMVVTPITLPTTGIKMDPDEDIIISDLETRENSPETVTTVLESQVSTLSPRAKVLNSEHDMNSSNSTTKKGESNPLFFLLIELY